MKVYRHLVEIILTVQLDVNYKKQQHQHKLLFQESKRLCGRS